MAAKDTHTLKNLISAKRRLDLSLTNINIEEEDIWRKKKGLTRDLEKVIKEIAKLGKTDIIVSEHAILRYLERVEGLDLKEIQKKILTKKVKFGHKALGNGKFPEKNFQVVIKNNVVVTVQTKN